MVLGGQVFECTSLRVSLAVCGSFHRRSWLLRLSTLATLDIALSRYSWELDSTLQQGLVNLSEIGEDLLFRLELFAPLFYQECDTVLNLLIHLGVVEHGDELLHEGLVRNLLVERGLALVHQDVQQAQGEEDHSELRHLESLQELVGDDLGVALFGIDLVNDFVDHLDSGALVIGTGGLLDQLGQLTLIHSLSGWMCFLRSF